MPQDKSLVGTSLRFTFDAVVVDNKQHECKIVGDDDNLSSSKPKSETTTANELAESIGAKKVSFVFVVRRSLVVIFHIGGRVGRCSSSKVS